MDELDDALPRDDVLGLVHPRAAGADATLTAHVGHLRDDERGAADGARAQVHQMPVVRRAVLSRVLAHGRDDDPVRQEHVPQPERREHGRRRRRRGHRHAALLLRPGREPAVDRLDELRVAELQIVVGHAEAPRQEAHRELDRLEAAVVALRLLEPLEAHLRGALQTLDVRPPLLLVGDERLLHLVVTLERAAERDRVLHRELRPRADREVRGVRRVADQHEVPVMPGPVLHRREVAPERAVLEEAVALELLGEQPLGEGDRLILVRLVEARAPPRGLRRLEDERGHRRVVAIGVDPPEAVVALLEDERECRVRERRAEPDELVRPPVHLGPEVLGVTAPDKAVDAVGGQHEVGAGVRAEVGHLVLEAEDHAELRAAALQALGRQAAGHRPADTRGAAGDESDPPRQLLLGRCQRQLVELERPVLDVEGVLRRERDVPTEGRRVADDVDRVVIDVAHDPGRPAIAADREHAEPGDKHDARQRIDQLDARTAMGVDVRRVIALERGETALDRGHDAGRIVSALEAHEARQALGVDGVVGRRRPDLGDRGRLDRRDELGHPGVVVEAEDLAAGPAEPSAQPWRDVQRERTALGGWQDRHVRPAEGAAAPPALGNRLLGARDQLDRRLVGLAHGGAPRDRAVLGEHQRPRVGPPGDGLRHFARDPEARTPVVERDDVLAIDAFERVGRAVVVRQRDDRVGVRVHHAPALDEAVQQRLDRRPRPPGLLERARQVRHHLLIVHLLTLEQRADVVHAHAREVLALDRFQIGAASLHAQDVDRPVAVIALGRLDRRVASPPHDERGLGTDQAGGVDESVELGEIAGFDVAPAGPHPGPTIPRRILLACDGRGGETGASGVIVPPAPMASGTRHHDVRGSSGKRRGADARSPVAKDRAALVLRLIGAVAGAEHRTGQASDERPLTCRLTATGDGSTSGAQSGADEATDRARLRDAKRAIATSGAVGGHRRDRPRR